MENEKFSIKKFGLSFIQWLPWVKTIRIMVGVGIVLLVGLTIWRAYFKGDVVQKQTQTQAPVIHQQPGSTVILQGPTQTVVEKKKIEPFIGIVATVGKDGEYQIGGFVGIKF